MRMGLQIAEPQVARFCEEAESHLAAGRFSQLAYQLLTSADVVLANASEKGVQGQSPVPKSKCALQRS